MDTRQTITVSIGLVFVVSYAIMVWSTYANIDKQLNSTPDLNGYGLSVPSQLAISGFVMGILGGLYAYAQINTTAVFVVAIMIALLALAISYAALCLTAITH